MFYLYFVLIARDCGRPFSRLQVKQVIKYEYLTAPPEQKNGPTIPGNYKKYFSMELNHNILKYTTFKSFSTDVYHSDKYILLLKTLRIY